MCVKLMAKVWTLDLPTAEKFVLLALADMANVRKGNIAWPSISTLKQRTGLSESSLQRSIKSLAESGNITRSEVIGKGVKYTVHPRHSDTPVTQTPPSHRHPTPVTVTPKPLKEPLVVERASALSTNTRAKSASGYPAAFEEFWAAYPRHKAKGGALEAWLAARKRGVSAEHLHAMAVAYAPTAPPDPQFIPHAATWLNQSRYDDQPEETPSHDRTQDTATIRNTDQQRLRDAGPSNPRVLAFARMAGIIPPDDGTTVGADGSDATGSPANSREHLRLVGDTLPGFKFN